MLRVESLNKNGLNNKHYCIHFSNPNLIMFFLYLCIFTFSSSCLHEYKCLCILCSILCISCKFSNFLYVYYCRSGNGDSLGCGLSLLPSSGGQPQHIAPRISNLSTSPSPLSTNSSRSSHHLPPSTATSTWSSSSTSSMGPPISANGAPAHHLPHLHDSPFDSGTMDHGTAFKIHFNNSYRHIKFGDGIDVKVRFIASLLGSLSRTS